jgi:hypothetical protein
LILTWEFGWNPDFVTDPTGVSEAFFGWSSLRVLIFFPLVIVEAFRGTFLEARMDFVTDAHFDVAVGVLTTLLPEKIGVSG